MGERVLEKCCYEATEVLVEAMGKENGGKSVGSVERGVVVLGYLIGLLCEERGVVVSSSETSKEKTEEEEEKRRRRSERGERGRYAVVCYQPHRPPFVDTDEGHRRKNTQGRFSQSVLHRPTVERRLKQRRSGGRSTAVAEGGTPSETNRRRASQTLPPPTSTVTLPSHTIGRDGTISLERSTR